MAIKKTATELYRLNPKISLENEQIKIKASSESLKNKISMSLDAGDDLVYWHLKFNIILNEATVTPKTTYVMETNGYVLSTVISYDSARHLISISPTDIYMPDEYYILTVTRKVESASGKRLRRDIHIMFKLIGSQIAETKMLPRDAYVPPAKPRTNSYRRELAEKIRASGGAASKLGADGVAIRDSEKYRKVQGYQLPLGPFGINVALLLIGAVGAPVCLFVADGYPLYIALAVLLAGIIHIVVQLVNKPKRARTLYNFGAMFFNVGGYKIAMSLFKSAAAADEYNEMAEYAIRKTAFYLE